MSKQGRPNFFRFKRKIDVNSDASSTVTGVGGPSRGNKRGKISGSNSEGKTQTTISKFFISSKQNCDKKGNTSPGVHTPDPAQSDDSPRVNHSDTSSTKDKKSATTTASPRVNGLGKDTLLKLQRFSSTFCPADSRTLVEKDPPEAVSERMEQLSTNRVPSNSFGDNFKSSGSSSADKTEQHPAAAKKPKLFSTADESEKKSPSLKYTPFEQQILDLKTKHPGLILMVESGYKYRFFGEDAKVAAEELNILASMNQNFLSASIPTHRLHIHLRRLVENGHKVGVVKQTETTAVKKSNTSTKNTIFSRKLDAIYTKSTLIGEDVEPAAGSAAGDEDGPIPSSVSSMVCIAELPRQEKDCRLCDIGVVILEPATGEATFVSFTDQPNRAELEKILKHTRPVEILIPMNISRWTEELILKSSASVERIPEAWFDLSESLSVAADFLGEQAKKRLGDLPPVVMSALAALLTHLRDFGLAKALSPESLKPFTMADRVLQMDAGTVKNMELFDSSLDKKKGSLCWIMDHTITCFGSRLLRRWVSQPLRQLEPLLERQEAVTELLRPEVTAVVTRLKSCMVKLPDLEKDLTCVLHGKITPAGFGSLLSCLGDLYLKLKDMEMELWTAFSNDYIETLCRDVVENLQGITEFHDNLNFEAAREGQKTKLLKNWSAFPDVTAQLEAITEVTKKLDELRPQIARTLGQFSVNYTKVSGMEYLVETKTKVTRVPHNWNKISSTKQVDRWRPPSVANLFGDLCRHRELLEVACHSAWLQTLENFAQQYHTYKAAVASLATLDVLMSLAHVSSQPDYCRPILQEGTPLIDIKNGRHPILPLLLPSAQDVVANDTALGVGYERCMIVTGPNMGGKSSYIRQVALLVIMAQIGCYIPAESATISLVDAIFTRMGSRDELQQGRSTLLVELEEASLMLRRATPHSLAILDELGRGTSSCDGAAIAVAALHHIVTKVHCLTLFVTHYPVVMTLEQQCPGLVRNYHLSFTLSDAQDESGVQILTFLYRVKRGGAHLSYGLNVARLAGLPSHILRRASDKAQQLQRQVVTSSQRNNKFQYLWQCTTAKQLHRAVQDCQASQ